MPTRTWSVGVRGMISDRPARRIKDLPRIRAAVLALGILGVVVASVAVSPGSEVRASGVARLVRMAAQSWQQAGTSRRCPSYADLVQAGLFEAGTLDAATVRIACDQADIVVRWAGSDGDFDTSDDEVIPDPLGDPRPLVVSGSAVPLVVIVGITLAFAVTSILAGLRCWPRTPLVARLAATSGWLVIAGGVTAGLIDLSVSQIAASRPSLSQADAQRSLARGYHRFLAEAAMGLLVGAPGALLRPRRTRRGRRVNEARVPA
jgi:hypothetical protein